MESTSLARIFVATFGLFAVMPEYDTRFIFFGCGRLAA
jgi:hypothetical protein